MEMLSPRRANRERLLLGQLLDRVRQLIAGKRWHRPCPGVDGMLVRHNSLHVMILMPSAKEDLSHPIPVGQHIGLGPGRSTQLLGRLKHDTGPGQQCDLLAAGLPSEVATLDVSDFAG